MEPEIDRHIDVDMNGDHSQTTTTMADKETEVTPKASSNPEMRPGDSVLDSYAQQPIKGFENKGTLEHI
jgi:hypothetical protein